MRTHRLILATIVGLLFLGSAAVILRNQARTYDFSSGKNFFNTATNDASSEISESAAANPLNELGDILNALKQADWDELSATSSASTSTLDFDLDAIIADPEELATTTSTSTIDD